MAIDSRLGSLLQPHTNMASSNLGDGVTRRPTTPTSTPIIQVTQSSESPQRPRNRGLIIQVLDCQSSHHLSPACQSPASTSRSPTEFNLPTQRMNAYGDHGYTAEISNHLVGAKAWGKYTVNNLSLEETASADKLLFIHDKCGKVAFRFTGGNPSILHNAEMAETSHGLQDTDWCVHEVSDYIDPLHHCS
jgi:hypothetical protein